MKKKHNFRKWIIVAVLAIASSSYSQDKIFSIGYTQNFVSKDSSNVSFTIDFNRVPGKTEAAGGYFLVNEPIGKLNFFLKPTADVNLGSYTTLAANNIAVGLPFGLSTKIGKDDPAATHGIFFGSLEVGPDFIADKVFNNYLYYVSPGFVLNYSNTSKKETVIDVGVGFKYGIGQRQQVVDSKLKNDYNKYIIPIGVAFNTFKSKDDKFHHIKLSGIYKYNYLLKDKEPALKKSNIYTQLKLDYFFISQLGINLTYTAGYEEPLFKKVNSLAFGLTFARK